MPQINLLKQTSNEKRWGEIIPSILVKVLVVVVLALGAYYGWLFTKVKRVTSQALTLQQSIDSAKADIGSLQRRDELSIRQNQLKQISQLIDQHLYWTSLLPKLAEVTYNKAAYTSIEAQSDGTLDIQMQVPSYEDLDKFLQVFDLPDYNKYFSDVRIGSIGETQMNNALQISVNVRMNFDPGLLKSPQGN